MLLSPRAQPFYADGGRIDASYDNVETMIPLLILPCNPSIEIYVQHAHVSI
jgi:hypothetical protein